MVESYSIKVTRHEDQLMADYSNRSNRNRIVIKPPTRPARRGSQPVRRGPAPRTREGLLAISVIAAAALATFIALFLTSRPYDPMNSTALPEGTVPQGPVMVQPSTKPSPSTSPQQKLAPEQSPTPASETTGASGSDDAGIQSQIERTLAADPTLAKLDVSTLVERGKVTLVGSVSSANLKSRVEKAVSSVKGVVSVDNQLVVTEATPQDTGFSLGLNTAITSVNRQPRVSAGCALNQPLLSWVHRTFPGGIH